VAGIAIGMLQRDGLIVAVSLTAGAIITIGMSATLQLAGGAILAGLGLAGG
jgi:hypothetical protein